MDKKISQLDAVTTLNNNDVLPIVNGGVTKKVSVSQLIQVGGSTNLTYTASPTNGIVNSDTGTDATLPLADGTNAGLFTPAEKTKLSGIQTGAEVNVNADWNSVSGDALILNKPTIPSAVTQTSQLTNNGADGVNNFITTLNIQDNITNGVTDKAPSQNSVFDALALKQNILAYTPYRYVDATRINVSGTLTESVLNTIVINAGSFNGNDFMKVIWRVAKTTALGTITIRLRSNTTNTLLGATLLATSSMSTGNRNAVFLRHFDLIGGQMIGWDSGVAIGSDITSGSTNNTSNVFDTTSVLFLFTTIQLTNVGDTATSNFVNVTN